MTMFLENVRLALSGLKANKSRTFLTMLGIIIGIAAVIAIETVGNSLTLSVSNSMQSMGANNITVYVTQREPEKDESEDGIVFGTISKSRPVTEDDYITNEIIYNLVDQFPGEIDAISASESVGTGSVTKGTNTCKLAVTGVSLGYFKANDTTMLAGNLFSSDEFVNKRRVIVVDSKYIDELYDGDYIGSIGKTVEIELNSVSQEFTICGVFKYQESGMPFGNPSATGYIPLTLAQEINHSKNYSNISIVASVGVDSDDLAARVKDYINGFYRSNQYFEVDSYSMASMVSILGDMMGTITTAISVIAGIALLVGGIGVMNIMLVSITERTREIGTRKALGATNGYIRMQFIIEAVVICSIGGIIGIVLGVGMGMLGAHILGYAAVPTISSILGSLAFSMGIGVFFGYYPANKAAKMNPIDALRYE